MPSSARQRLLIRADRENSGFIEVIGTGADGFRLYARDEIDIRVDHTSLVSIKGSSEGQHYSWLII